MGIITQNLASYDSINQRNPRMLSGLPRGLLKILFAVSLLLFADRTFGQNFLPTPEYFFLLPFMKDSLLSCSIFRYPSLVIYIFISCHFIVIKYEKITKSNSCQLASCIVVTHTGQYRHARHRAINVLYHKCSTIINGIISFIIILNHFYSPTS